MQVKTVVLLTVTLQKWDFTILNSSATLPVNTVQVYAEKLMQQAVMVQTTHSIQIMQVFQAELLHGWMWIIFTLPITHSSAILQVEAEALYL